MGETEQDATNLLESNDNANKIIKLIRKLNEKQILNQRMDQDQKLKWGKSAIAIQSDYYKNYIVNPDAKNRYEKYFAKKNKIFSYGVEMNPKKLNIYFCKTKRSAVEIINDIVNVRYLAKDDNICVHALIDAEDSKIYQTIPWNYRPDFQFSDCFDDGSVNIMFCEPRDRKLSEKAMKTSFYTLLDLIACLCNEYAISLNSESVLLFDNKGTVSDLSNYIGGYYSIEQFFSEASNQMQAVSSMDSIKNNHYAY